jgi:guanine nucleotide-binding protein G(i) subunit alpha
VCPLPSLAATMLIVSSFFKDFERMTSPKYSPTEADVLELLKNVEPPGALTLETRRYHYRFLNFSGQQSGPTGWYNISSVSSIIYCVNIAEYDQARAAPGSTSLGASLDLFEATMKTDLETRPVILLLTHISEFRQKLAMSPLEQYFPDYSGGDDAELAANYILRKFYAVQHSGPIYAYTFDLTTTKDVWKICDAHHEATKETKWEGFLSGIV